MKNTNTSNFTWRVKVWALLLPALLLFASVSVPAQQDMSNMPGMSKTKPTSKPKSMTRKKRKATRKKQTAKKHDMANMPGMNMPGMKMPAMHRRRAASRRKKAPAQKNSANKNQMDNMPGMNMPTKPSSSPKQSAAPQPTPQQMQMNMPGMQMPPASPSASPQTQMNMPGMQMPTASPNPQGSPQQKMDMNMPMPGASPSPGAMGGMKGMENMPGMGSMNMGPLMVMSGDDMGIRVGSSDTNVMSMGAMGSGTSWQPSSGPMHMYHKVSGDWLLMFHYNIVAGMNRQGGPRGVTRAESANWFMPMAYHKLGKGTVQLRGMFSFEPFTFPPGGSPLLFQTGETYKGQPLIDKQHPHDLFMELSAQYTLPLGEHGTWFTYFGYPGEPALGPVAFMHRMSASENPSATLAHHLQDSTHISFGVLTTGFTYRWFKLEGSIFNGREPDENRYNFEAHPWNSHSARFTFAPNKSWAMQVSYGLLRKPEASEPNTDIRRATASVQYNKPFKRGNWASAFIWGRNHASSPGEVHNLNGYTAESTVNFLDKNYFYTRLELVDKNELLRATDRALLGIKNDHPSFRIGAYTFGGVRDIWNTKKLSMAIGSDLTLYSKPAILDRIYGNNPVSWRLFLRLRPSKMDMSTHGMHENMSGESKSTIPVSGVQPAPSATPTPTPDGMVQSPTKPDMTGMKSSGDSSKKAGMGDDMSKMDMDPYFTAINYPVPRDTMMVMLLSDFQSARSTNNFFTGMAMVQYGVTSRWTVGFMAEGQKIFGLPTTYGGLRINSYFRVFPHDHLLNFTLYGEYEGLNGAALYKMEVAGFGGEDLNEPLAPARRTPVRTFEQRAIMYHDWGRVNLTFNFINETGLKSGENDFGYAWGVFRQPAFRAMQTDKEMAGMAGMPKKKAPPVLSLQRLGYGVEMIGALGSAHQFGFDWQRQQHYVGPVFSYSASKQWTVHVEPTFGLSNVSDPFMLRMGVGYSIDHLLHRRSPTP